MQSKWAVPCLRYSDSIYCFCLFVCMFVCFLFQAFFLLNQHSSLVFSQLILMWLSMKALNQRTFSGLPLEEGVIMRR